MYKLMSCRNSLKIIRVFLQILDVSFHSKISSQNIQMNNLYKVSLHNRNYWKLVKEPNPYRLRVWLLVIFYRLYTFLCIVDLSTFLASSEIWWLHKKGGVYAILLQARPSSVVYDQGFIGTFNQTLFKRYIFSLSISPTCNPVSEPITKRM